MRPIDGDRLMMHLTDWWFSSFEQVETDESKAIKTVIDKIDQTLGEFALEKQEADRWIPVTERLPELTHFMYDVTPFSDTVLVTVRNQYGAERLVLGNYEQHRGWNLELLDSTDERFLWHVIAWRPLPEPYTEEEA